MLFAKSVVLVEGDAEEILVPILFKKVVGLSLDELGVSLINIRSTGFKNVAVLFHDLRIRKRCSIITDLDAAFVDTAPIAGEPAADTKYKEKCLASQTAGAERKVILDAFCNGNGWLSAHYAEHTFEVDLVLAGNGAQVASVVPIVYTDPDTRALAEAELTSGVKTQYGRRVLTMATNQGKGWFAILLGKHIDYETALPDYIHKAIFFARQVLTVEIFFNIYSYRINCAREAGAIAPADASDATDQLKTYRDGALDLPELKAAMVASLPGDQIHAILADVV